MKRSRLSYDEWKCIISKKQHGKRVCTDFLEGYIGFIEIQEVSEVQKWNFRGEEIVVCDKGIKWLSILPQDAFYCITAMMNEKEVILLWYIDMIAEQGVDMDGIPYFYDLYLELVVYSDGTVAVDDEDELEDALQEGDISEKQYRLAIETADILKEGMLRNIEGFTEFTKKCLEIVK